jgi:hypothetical protein
MITDMQVDPMGRFELSSDGYGGPSKIRAYRQGGVTIAASAPVGARPRDNACIVVQEGRMSLPAHGEESIAFEILTCAVREILTARGFRLDPESPPDLVMKIDCTFEAGVRVLPAKTDDARKPAVNGIDKEPQDASSSAFDPFAPDVGKAVMLLTVTDVQTEELLWRAAFLKERAETIEGATDELRTRARAVIEYALALLPTKVPG